MNVIKSTSLKAALLLPALLLSPVAFAQDADIVDQGDEAEAAVSGFEAGSSEDDQGWEYAMSLGANAAWSNADNVPGVTDGSTVAFGLLLNGHANLTAGQSAWQNSLKVQHTQTKTPQIPVFIKSADQLSFDSTYLFRLPQMENLGPYARFKLDTQVVGGSFVSANEVDVEFVDFLADENGDLQPDSSFDHFIPNADDNGIYEYDGTIITSPLQPLTSRFSVGAFANPIESEKITVKTKLGVGAQNIREGGYALTSTTAAADRTAADGATDVYDLVTFTYIQGGFQAGAEFGLDLNGSLRENVNWGVSALFFAPLAPEGNLLDPAATATDEDTGEDYFVYAGHETQGQFGFNLNSDITANVGVKLSRFASLDFALSAKRVPLVTPDWQIQSNVMLSFAFNLIDSAEPAAE